MPVTVIISQGVVPWPDGDTFPSAIAKYAVLRSTMPRHLHVCSFPAALLFAFFAPACSAQFGRPDIFGTWNISIQITGGSQVPAGVSMPSTIYEVLSLLPSQQLQEQTSGDILPALVNSAGFGNWTYIYNSSNDGGVKFVSLVTTKDGMPAGIRTTVLRLTPARDSLTITGTYKSTLVDPSGNVIYQLNGTLTGTSLHIDIFDENLS